MIRTALMMIILRYFKLNIQSIVRFSISFSAKMAEIRLKTCRTRAV
jgi:hypothetical protein